MVEVRGADVENVTIVPVRGGSIAVRVMLDSKPVSFTQLHIDPEDHAFLPAIVQTNSARALAISNRVFATTYRGSVSTALAPELYVSRIRFNGVDSAVPAFAPTEIALSGTLDIYVANGSPIEGRVSDENGNPLKGAVIALVPEERSRHDL